MTDSFPLENKDSPENKDIFISYSRKDKAFVRTLYEALSQSKYKTWVDWEDIPGTSLWWEEIKAGIEAAHTFVFVLSPDSASSKVCRDEIEHAAKHNKRLIPIVWRDGFQTGWIHPAVAKIDWLFFRQSDDFDNAFQSLVKALNTDLGYVKAHARLLVRALEWDREERDESFLLRNTALETSEQWLKQSNNKEPEPIDLQIEYIVASQSLRQQLREAEASHKQTEQYLREIEASHKQTEQSLREVEASRKQTEQSLQTAEKELKKAVVYHQPKRRSVILTSVGVTLLVLIVRFLGIMQPLELKAFDWLMRLRPSERTDHRFLIVEVTEEDIQAQIKRGERPIGSLSDISLNRLLDKLEQNQARLIGLDIYRDYQTSQPDLEARLKQNDRLFALCKVAKTDSQGKVTEPGIAPPPEVKPERVGFSDFIEDDDGVVRRHLLIMDPEKIDDSTCGSKQAFSLLIAKRYLELEPGGSIQYTDPLIADGPLQIGDNVFERLETFTGGYQGVDKRGYQILLNYRAYKQGEAKESFRTVKLEEVLNDRLPEGTFKDRIVLIGVTATSTVFDYWPTPYGSGSEELSGVLIQAHMVSQILSYVLDERPLLWVWPQGVEALWILGWSLVGGILTWPARRRRYFILAIGIALGGLYITCFVFMTQAVWAPLIPSALSQVVTSVVLIYVAFRPAPSPALAASSEERTIANAMNHRRESS